MPYDNSGLSAKGFKRLNYSNNLENKVLPQRKSKLTAVVVIITLVSMINISATVYNYILLQQQQKNLSFLKDENTQVQTKITEVLDTKLQADKQFNLLAKETKDINNLYKQNQEALKNNKTY